MDQGLGGTWELHGRWSEVPSMGREAAAPPRHLTQHGNDLAPSPA